MFSFVSDSTSYAEKMITIINLIHLVITILALNNLHIETNAYDVHSEYKHDLNIELSAIGKATIEELKNDNQVTNTTSVLEDCVGDIQFCNMSKEEYVQMLQDYIYPQTYEWILIATHTAVFVVGLIGNALVVIAVYRNHTMRTVTNYFIANLAVADFMVILFCLPPSVLWDVTETWFLGDALCKVLLYFQVSFSVNEYFCMLLYNFKKYFIADPSP